MAELEARERTIRTTKPSGFGDCRDRISDTIAAVEVNGSTVSWMLPNDLEFSGMSLAVNSVPGNSIVVAC